MLGRTRMDRWINGGFFCFEPGVFAYLAEDSVLEREPLERLAADGDAFRTRGASGLHGHLQGRGSAQRPVGLRRAAVARLGRGAREMTGPGVMETA